MPLDCTPAEIAPDLSMPTLEGLSWLLRHKEAWPQGFEWDYGDCEHCAMGFACQLWDSVHFPCTYEMASIFDMSPRQAMDIFVWLRPGFEEHITPEHVAAAIDTHLARSA